MNVEGFSLKDYLSSPTAISLDFDLDSPKLSSLLPKLFSHKSDLVFTKWKYLKKINEVLIEEGKLRPFSLFLKWTLRPTAYMHDEGSIYLSFGLLARRSSMVVLSVYLHELAHIWLSQRQDYPQIKALQKAFYEQFGENDLCALLSPIEIYADLLTLKILNEIKEYTKNKREKQKLLRIISDQAKTLNLLKTELEKLAGTV